MQLERSAAVFEQALVAHPTNALFRRNLAIAHSNTADVLTALKRPADALARQRQALASFEALSAADPANVAARNDVAISLSKIAEMHGRRRPQRRRGPRVRTRPRHPRQAMAAADPANDSLTARAGIRLQPPGHVAGQARRARSRARQSHARGHDEPRSAAREPGQRGVARRAGAGAGRPRRCLRRVRRRARERDPRRRSRRRRTGLCRIGRRSTTALREAGSIEGTNLETLENNRKALESVRKQRSR